MTLAKAKATSILRPDSLRTRAKATSSSFRSGSKKGTPRSPSSRETLPRTPCVGAGDTVGQVPSMVRNARSADRAASGGSRPISSNRAAKRARTSKLAILHDSARRLHSSAVSRDTTAGPSRQAKRGCGRRKSAGTLPAPSADGILRAQDVRAGTTTAAHHAATPRSVPSRSGSRDGSTCNDLARPTRRASGRVADQRAPPAQRSARDPRGAHARAALRTARTRL